MLRGALPKTKGYASVQMMGVVVVALLVCLFMVSIAHGATMTVVNNSEVVNGNIASPSDLISDPGPDGISLPEAMWAAISVSGPHTILFDPSLKGTTIALTGGLPGLNSGPITINGDIDGDGTPDIIIDGTNSSSSVGFGVCANDVTIRGLAILNFSWVGIQVFTYDAEGWTSIERVTIQSNTISAGWTGIEVYNGAQDCSIRDVEIIQNKLINNGTWGIQITAAGDPPAADNQIVNVAITENTISNVAGGNKGAVFVTCTPHSEGTNNLISGLEISNNTITGHTYNNLLISAANGQDCQNNRIDNTLISGNVIDGSPVTMEILGVGAGIGANGNMVSNLRIVENILRGGGIQLVGADAYDAYENGIDTVFIGRNWISNAAANGVFIVAGCNGARNNTVSNTTILNNVIINNDCGILLHGHEGDTPNNIIENVYIVNNTIFGNGNLAWAGGININSQSTTNLITGVKITNTILWNNEGNDYIRGSESPESVTFSIINDTRYVGSNGNSYSDPRFVDPTNGNFRLRARSPCIDKGDNTAVVGVETDFEGDPRVIDGDNNGIATVDIGSDEYIPAVFPAKAMVWLIPLLLDD